mmetsp:Transcript_10379/g.10395  ORF Transcript_10379/g.10395 Transcript_10379/m.10395 type:complete len:139 (+) Transcript_10379:197-613(+)
MFYEKDMVGKRKLFYRNRKGSPAFLMEHDKYDRDEERGFVQCCKEHNFLRKISKQDISKIYHIGKEIGQGRYGIVRLIAKKSFENKRFALKSILRDSLSHVELTYLQREIEVLIKIEHPNIINFTELYLDDNFVHFVT